MNKTIIQYIRKGKKVTKANGAVVGSELKGVFAAVKINGYVGLGVALCDSRDTFNKDHGVSLALGRAYQSATNPVKESFDDLPQSIRKEAEAFGERTRKYFRV